MRRRRENIILKTPDQMRKMRTAGLVVAQIHQAIRDAVEPGMTTADLDHVALDVLKRNNATSNFYGYYDYPGQICTSVNEVIVHGIPGNRVLEPGDLVSFDCGAIVGGWHGDGCFSLVLPGGDPEVTARRQRLCDRTEKATWVGVAAMARGKYVGDIGAAIDDYVVGLNPTPDIVQDYVGHGIGRAMHEDPDVPNYRTHFKGSKLVPGMVLCIEPQLTEGKETNVTLEDDWTVVTLDGSDACHWEYEVALHEGGVWVLTAPDGGKAGLAPFGITPAPLD